MGIPLSRGSEEIHLKTDIKAWHHIASAENISDILTRGAPPNQLGPDSVWQRGPQWLVLQPEQWPATPPDMVQLSPGDTEMEEKFRVKSMCKVASVLKNSVKTAAAMPNFDRIILRASKQGSLKKLIRSTALVMRVFLADYRIVDDSIDTYAKPGNKKLNKISDVTASEYLDAWLFLIKYF